MPPTGLKGLIMILQKNEDQIWLTVIINCNVYEISLNIMQIRYEMLDCVRNTYGEVVIVQRRFLYIASSTIFCLLFAFLGFLHKEFNRVFDWMASLGFAILVFSHLLWKRP